MDTKLIKQKILDLAIRGKLVPQNPADEPASVLLERIKAEKAQLIKEGVYKSEKPYEAIESVPFEIPHNWVWCRAGEFSYVASGSTPSKDSFVESGIPYIKMYNLRNQKIDFYYQPQYIKEEVHNGKLKRSRTEVGDLLMNIVGPPLGKLAIIPDSLPQANFNQAAVLFRPLAYKKVIVKYLFYYLSQMSEIDSVWTKGSAGQVNISLTQSQNLRIALPPLEEQKRIVAEIDRWFKCIDELEKNQQDLHTAIQQAKSKILDLAIHGKLVAQDSNDEPASALFVKIKHERNKCVKDKNCKKEKLLPLIETVPFEIPENWEWCRLGGILKFINGRAYKKEELLNEGKYKVLRVGNFFTNDSWYYSNLELEDNKYCNKGDLLYAWSASFGPKIWDGGKTIFHYHIWNVRFEENYLNKKYLYYFFEYDKNRLKDDTTGSTMIHIAMEHMVPRLFPLPPLEEQKRIVTKIEELFAQLDKIEESLI